MAGCVEEKDSWEALRSAAAAERWLAGRQLGILTRVHRRPSWQSLPGKILNLRVEWRDSNNYQLVEQAACIFGATIGQVSYLGIQFPSEGIATISGIVSHRRRTVRWLTARSMHLLAVLGIPTFLHTTPAARTLSKLRVGDTIG